MTTLPGDTEEEVRAASIRWLLLLSVVAGAVVGWFGRNVPVAIALRSGAATTETRSCGMEEAAECALEHMPAAFGALLVLGLVMVVISVLFAVGGVALVIVGVVRRRRSGRAWVPLALFAAGTALVMPALWLLVSFIGAVRT